MLIPLGKLVSKHNLKVTGVLHVGAHQCEEQKVYQDDLKLTHKDVLWVEGNQTLIDQAKKHDPKLEILQGFVADVDDFEADFIVTNNGQSSSLLELHEHKREHPSVKEVARHSVKTITLRTLLAQYAKKQPTATTVDASKLNLLNIDIQGAELLALQGMGDELLAQFDYLYLEVNTKELYKGCALVGEIDEFLAERGFERTDTEMTKHGWGDAFYIRRAQGAADKTSS
jgi:FkbM family methyltransferase